MKAVLIFELPEDKEDFDLARKATDFSMALNDIQNEVFRPARKHGYDDKQIQVLVDELDDKSEGKATELISLLEERYYKIINNYGLSEY
jgi:hypothetical protein